MTRAAFKELVVEAIDSLPQEFQEQLNNVDVVVEDLPTQDQLASVGLTHPLSLFGLYQGVPQTRRGIHYSMVPPDKISIFKVPIETSYLNPETIKAKVRAVVLHEIGHHFGMSEGELSYKRKAQ